MPEEPICKNHTVPPAEEWPSNTQESQSVCECERHNMSEPINSNELQHRIQKTPVILAQQRQPKSRSSSPKQLDRDLSEMQMTTDYLRKALRTFRSATQPLTMGKRLSETIHAVTLYEGVTLFATLLASLSALLYRYTSQDDIVVGWMGNGCSGTEKPTGTPLDTIVLRINVLGNPSFRELIRRVQEITPVHLFGLEVSPELQTGRHANGHDPCSAIATLFFSFRSEIPKRASGSLGTNSSAIPLDMHVELANGPDGFFGTFTYNADLFDVGTISRMVGHWLTLLESAAADPGRRVSDLPLLGKAERHQLLVEWNDTKVYYQAVCLHELIEEQVRRTPDNVAVVFEDEELTYRELNVQANQVANYLQKAGVGPEVLVGICVERSLEMVAGLLGILKAGGTYVPLDPGYPQDRLAFMVEDSGLKVLLTKASLLPKLSDLPVQLICLDSQSDALSREKSTNCGSGVGPENLAYVIYTSGSTGKPKGVQVSHRALTNFLMSMQAKPGMSVKDALLAVTTISFDIAGLELYLPLTVGARVVLVGRETVSDGERLVSKLESSKITCMQATPATWRLLLEAGWKGQKDLKILCGGEMVPRDLVNQLVARSSSVWNMYGPTETTIWSAIHEINSSDGPVVIGRPIANTEIHILDSFLQPVPVGVTGELYIGGDGLARGYLHRPELTAERFVRNPFSEQVSRTRLYRTGDLARYRPDGNIECLGRMDYQVKVRGFRIELGEIEAALGACTGVHQNVVMVQENNGDKQLVAYVVLGPSGSHSITELRNHLKRTLPDYMLPSRFVFMETLPLTANGKIDRKALPRAPHLELEQIENTAVGETLEAQLSKIWRSVLKLPNVSLTENFFELGGHSLLVAKLLNGIERTFGKKLSMATIFEAPTIEQQAAMLRGAVTPRSSVMIPIQPSGSKPPFIFFGFNAGPLFLPLARYLGTDQPLLCVDPTPLEVSRLPTPCKMEDITACLIKEIREVLPEGPYYLGGMCLGGLLAYETARQLVAHGEKVALLALVEPQAPVDSNEAYNLFCFNWLSQRLSFHLRNVVRIGVREALPYVWSRTRTFLHYVGEFVRQALHDLYERVENSRPQNFLDVARLATLDSPTRSFNGRVTLFQAVNRSTEDNKHRHKWEQLAATIEVHDIPGYSSWVDRFFLEPHVEVLAHKLGRCLARSQQESRS